MNYEATSESVRDLLSGNRTYGVPRYQREYSWTNAERAIFTRDLIKQITRDDDGFRDSGYFLGIVVLEGERKDSCVEVIDGQQRLTTITIALVAIRDIFRGESTDGNDKLAKSADAIDAKYIFHTNDEGAVEPVLKPSSSNPFFIRCIQASQECIIEDRGPETEEEASLCEAYSWFKKHLSLKHIQELAVGTACAESITEENYIDFLCAFRSQLLNADLITVYSPNRAQANLIFENLNSKGLPLTPIDLIKNFIMSQVRPVAPLNDEVYDLWRTFKNSLEDTPANFNEFFTDYWRVTHPSKSITEKRLYSHFLNEYESASEEKLRQLLANINEYLPIYREIVHPDANKYVRQQHKYQERYLKAINSLNLKQTRVPLLALLIRGEQIRKQDKLEALQLLSNFAFAAFGLSSGIRANKLTKPFRDYAKALQDDCSATSVKKANEALGRQLVSFLEKESFIESFSQLEYTKNADRGNGTSLATNYAIHEIANYMDGTEGNDPRASIEHIVDESTPSSIYRSIGNLLVLETQLNNDIDRAIRTTPGCNPLSVKRDAYAQSGRAMARDFASSLSTSPTFGPEDISERSQKLANLFWDIAFKKYEWQHNSPGA